VSVIDGQETYAPDVLSSKMCTKSFLVFLIPTSFTL
jgi:hypothetical protein